MNERALWVGGIAVGAVALVGGLVYAASNKPSSQTGAATPPSTNNPPFAAGTTIGLTDASVILQPGNQTIVEDPGTTVIANLPQGGTWGSSPAPGVLPTGVSSIDSSNNAGTNVQKILFDGSATATVTLNWSDSSGTSQSTQLTIQPTPGIQGIVLTPGSQTVQAPAGTLIVLQLPNPTQGGSWGNSQTSGVVVPSGSSPETYKFVGPTAQITIPWTDANGNAVTTNLTIHT